MEVFLIVNFVQTDLELLNFLVFFLIKNILFYKYFLDIPNNWVHLICALYTPGIQFVDQEHLSGISWQNVDYRNFGRKQCGACIDQLDSRTGITVKCDAGLCRNFYHVTCAQRFLEIFCFGI